jgi:phosphopantetheine binding protein
MEAANAFPENEYWPEWNEYFAKPVKDFPDQHRPLDETQDLAAILCHALLAVHIFAEIEKVFKVRLPLATLYEAPAIEDIARILSGEVVSSSWSSLVAIQPLGSRPPFFCFHGDGGNVLIYRKLAQYLGPGQPFCGFAIFS